MTLRNLYAVLLLIGMSVLNFGCTASENNEPDNSTSIALANGNSLVFEHAGLTDAHKNTLEDKIAMGIVTINNLLAIDKVQIRIVDNATYIIPEIGIGGFNPSQNEVLIAIDTNFGNLNNSLEEELIPLLAHEVHHAKRRRSVGYGSTLLEAAVSEGLADHFSIEVSAINPPPWAIALSGSELQEWIDTASSTWNASSYNHNAWFFGTDQNIPRWTGYSIGYELVKNFIWENPGRQASNLHNEPANSFLPQ